MLKLITSPGLIPGSESFDPSGYIPGSDITAFGTEWGHNQGPTGLPFGPPGFPATNRPDGIAFYATKNNGIVTGNTFVYGAARFVNGVPVLGAVTPSPTGFLCTVQLAALFVPPPPGGFSFMIVDSAGDGYITIGNPTFADLPAPGTFRFFTLTAPTGGPTGQPPNRIHITASNTSNPPGSFVACSFVMFEPLP